MRQGLKRIAFIGPPVRLNPCARCRQHIPLAELDFARRDACRFCDDFSAEYADISFGGLGAYRGWTTVVTRSPLARAAYADAREKCLKIQSIDDHPRLDARILSTIMESSTAKKQQQVVAAE